MYHPKVLWNHSLRAQHRQGGDRRAGTRDCKLSSPLLSEDKNHLPPQEATTDLTDLICSMLPKNLVKTRYPSSLSSPRKTKQNKTAQKTNPVNKHDLLSMKTKSTRIKNSYHSTKSKFESHLSFSKDCGFISWAVENPKLKRLSVLKASYIHQMDFLDAVLALQYPLV